jgi:hypothetical protein
MKTFKEFISTLTPIKENNFVENIKNKTSTPNKWAVLGGFYIRKNGPFPSISYINDRISDFIKKEYKDYGYKKYQKDTIKINGQEINITLAINNYLVFDAFCAEKNIKSASGFINEMINNIDYVYGASSDFFKQKTAPLLIKTKEIGEMREKQSLEKFEKVMADTYPGITISKPTLREDISGIDGHFRSDGVNITIQVKPLSSIDIWRNGKVAAFSNGSLSLSTDYLILYRKKNHIIIKNTKESPIEIHANKFVFHPDNIVHNDFSPSEDK